MMMMMMIIDERSVLLESAHYYNVMYFTNIGLLIKCVLKLLLIH